ncbi:hypothetical protein [Escherichia phage vB_EcoM-ZQ1]|nr:hypothetical protein [Escherichia phage vB_EcoM-ZQ1]
MWNNNVIEPTFTPSLLVNATDPALFCHLFLTDGKYNSSETVSMI